MDEHVVEFLRLMRLRESLWGMFQAGEHMIAHDIKATNHVNLGNGVEMTFWWPHDAGGQELGGMLLRRGVREASINFITDGTTELWLEKSMQKVLSKQPITSISDAFNQAMEFAELCEDD